MNPYINETRRAPMKTNDGKFPVYPVPPNSTPVNVSGAATPDYRGFQPASGSRTPVRQTVLRENVISTLRPSTNPYSHALGRSNDSVSINSSYPLIPQHAQDPALVGENPRLIIPNYTSGSGSPPEFPLVENPRSMVPAYAGLSRSHSPETPPLAGSYNPGSTTQPLPQRTRTPPPPQYDSLALNYRSMQEEEASPSLVEYISGLTQNPQQLPQFMGNSLDQSASSELQYQGSSPEDQIQDHLNYNHESIPSPPPQALPRAPRDEKGYRVPRESGSNFRANSQPPVQHSKGSDRMIRTQSVDRLQKEKIQEWPNTATREWEKNLRAKNNARVATAKANWAKNRATLNSLFTDPASYQFMMENAVEMPQHGYLPSDVSNEPHHRQDTKESSSSEVHNPIEKKPEVSAWRTDMKASYNEVTELFERVHKLEQRSEWLSAALIKRKSNFASKFVCANKSMLLARSFQCWHQSMGDIRRQNAMDFIAKQLGDENHREADLNHKLEDTRNKLMQSQQMLNTTELRIKALEQEKKNLQRVHSESCIRKELLENRLTSADNLISTCVRDAERIVAETQQYKTDWERHGDFGGLEAVTQGAPTDLLNQLKKMEALLSPQKPAETREVQVLQASPPLPQNTVTPSTQTGVLMQPIQNPNMIPSTYNHNQKKVRQTFISEPSGLC